MTSSDTHRVFLNKPKELIELLAKRVEVETQRGEVITGGLLAVDPVTDTAVLAELESDQKQLELNHVRIVSVPFVNWDKVKTVESSPEYRQSLEGLIQELRGGSGRSEAVSVEDVERRDRVREELSRHGLEVTSDGDNLVISGTVIIRPPYGQQHCDAPNEIILSRIRNILQSVS